MTDKDEWGPWIEHDGSGYPLGVVGRVCQAYEECCVRGVFSDGEFLCMGQYASGGSWNWENYPRTTKVIRYRIRRPRGLSVLQEIAENPQRELEHT